MLLCMIHFTAANAREKKNTHNTSIENNSLLLGLCTYISFVCLFFCLSHYPGGIIRSLQAGTYQLWHYRSRFPSIAHPCQRRGFVPGSFPDSQSCARPGAALEWRWGTGWALRRRQSRVLPVHPFPVPREVLVPSA